MSKRVAIIDLGSNSVRMAIFERTSRLGFFTVGEFKINVKLGEGAYENGGLLQESAMQNSYEALLEFKKLIKRYQVRKVMAVGTSALRDAPNKDEFLKRIRTLGIGLRVIDGNKEAYYDGVATLNLLPPLQDAICVDIGGGSTELVHIKDGKIEEVCSLNLGTVRIKELFFDKNEFKKVDKFIDSELAKVPSHFKGQTVIAIGGSLRAISNAIVEKSNYPIKILHGFKYDFEKNREFITTLSNAKIKDLAAFSIKKERFDTIREGAMIFNKTASLVGAKEIYTSGVGVREGLFLCSLMPRNPKFPKGFSPSLKSLLDRFGIDETANLSKIVRALFKELLPIHKLDSAYSFELGVAARLCHIGNKIGYYATHNHTAYIILNALNYGFTHEQKALIAMIVELHGKKAINEERYKMFGTLLPSKETIVWLSHLLEVAKVLDMCNEKNIKFKLQDATLLIDGIKQHTYIKESLRKISKPQDYIISFV